MRNTKPGAPSFVYRGDPRIFGTLSAAPYHKSLTSNIYNHVLTTPCSSVSEGASRTSDVSRASGEIEDQNGLLSLLLRWRSCGAGGDSTPLGEARPSFEVCYPSSGRHDQHPSINHTRVVNATKVLP